MVTETSTGTSTTRLGHDATTHCMRRSVNDRSTLDIRQAWIRQEDGRWATIMLAGDNSIMLAGDNSIMQAGDNSIMQAGDNSFILAGNNSCHETAPWLTPMATSPTSRPPAGCYLGIV